MDKDIKICFGGGHQARKAAIMERSEMGEL